MAVDLVVDWVVDWVVDLVVDVAADLAADLAVGLEADKVAATVIQPKQVWFQLRQLRRTFLHQRAPVSAQ